jgi:hypothetical protein
MQQEWRNQQRRRSRDGASGNLRIAKAAGGGLGGDPRPVGDDAYRC